MLLVKYQLNMVYCTNTSSYRMAVVCWTPGFGDRSRQCHHDIRFNPIHLLEPSVGYSQYLGTKRAGSGCIEAEMDVIDFIETKESGFGEGKLGGGKYDLFYYENQAWVKDLHLLWTWKDAFVSERQFSKVYCGLLR